MKNYTKTVINRMQGTQIKNNPIVSNMTRRKSRLAKITSLVIGLTSIPLVAYSQSNGVRVINHSNGLLKFMQIPAAHFPQTTPDNCGAAAANVITSSEIYKRLNYAIGFNEADLKNYLDTDKSKGINKFEMSLGLGNIAQYLNSQYRFSSNSAISTSWAIREQPIAKILGLPMTDTLASLPEVKMAMSSIQFWMLRSYSCVPIQGNLDHFYNKIDKRGNHWYVVYATGNVDANTPWIAVYDSVYNSPALPNRQDIAIRPAQILYASAVRDIWRASGESQARALTYVVNTFRK